MNISSTCEDGKLIISLSGELDHHAAKNAIPQISETVNYEFPTKIILDFSGINFMDSSGIALVIGAFKRSKNLGCDFCVVNVSRQAYKVFDAAGLCKLINIATKEAAIAK